MSEARVNRKSFIKNGICISSSTGSTYDFLSQGLDAVAQGQIGQAQADQYQKELDAYRQALANPGVATLPTSKINYSKILQRAFSNQ